MSSNLIREDFDDADTRDFWHGLSAAKGEPFTVAEWEREVIHLEHKLNDARRRLLSAHHTGYCRAARFQEGEA